MRGALVIRIPTFLPSFLQVRTIYLGWKGYAIHGTNKPYSIGRRDSHGCVRMYPEDIDICSVSSQSERP